MASVGSTLKHSEMQEVATSIDSRSSSLRVPSVREVLKKSMMESARRCLVVAMVCDRDVGNGEVGLMMWRAEGRQFVFRVVEHSSLDHNVDRGVVELARFVSAGLREGQTIVRRKISRPRDSNDDCAGSFNDVLF